MTDNQLGVTITAMISAVILGIAICISVYNMGVENNRAINACVHETQKVLECREAITNR